MLAFYTARHWDPNVKDLNGPGLPKIITFKHSNHSSVANCLFLEGTFIHIRNIEQYMCIVKSGYIYIYIYVYIHIRANICS